MEKQKLKPTNLAMLSTNGLNNIISLFVSTFLISYIYSISTNYILNIGLFYCFYYLSMLVFYVLISTIIDKTNRITFYRLAIIVRGIFILGVIFFGKNLAEQVILAGSMLGFSEACYWTSYNLMKNELVSRKVIKKYAFLQQLIDSLVKTIIPVVFGKIIDSDSFKTSAIIVLVIACIQLIISLFIKSKRPENSSFKFTEYVTHVKKLDEKHKSLILWSITTAFVYGLNCAVSTMCTILIMFNFSSNFSLGIFTSVFSALALLILIVFKKFTKSGNRSFGFYIFATLPAIATFLLILHLSKITVILYFLAYTISVILYVYSFDSMRNLVIKKLNMFDDIAEYQCSVDCSIEVGRILIFLLMIIAGIISSFISVNGITLLLKIMCVIAIIPTCALNLLVNKFEKSFTKITTEDDALLEKSEK